MARFATFSRQLFALTLAGLVSGSALSQAVPIPSRDRDNERATEREPDRDTSPKLLNDEQINLIKIYEIDLSEEPRITIDDDVLEKFLKEFSADDRIPKGRQAQREFMRAEGYQQLKLMFDLRAREYYGEAKMRGEPESLSYWHRLVHRPYIQEYFRPMFATGQVKGLSLFEAGRDRDRISYTNFYILTQLRFGSVPMIDRDKPEESLILQWGLPREEAKYPAPEEVENFKPYFRDADDPRFVRIVEWIETLYDANQNSNYGFTYPERSKKNEDAPDDVLED